MSFDVPDDLQYLESHEWIDPATGRVGISEFAQDELGDVVFVELPSVGDALDQQDELGVVESIKAVSDLYAPVSGEVTAVNDALTNEPELVNEAPFGDGWLVEIDFDSDDLEATLDSDDYRAQIA
ncbi:glycine cleavage system protein GcvH [Halobacterium sp. BOL4-2]|uniref:glycine cleavage system protein GcvH n=1 Tax=Halobacterium sp. BOL4-2 TaxID=2810537 RepID=UPI0019658CE7|nr:glycine cleavage system protein GcvH [Halobacterium sp. BOL4-2]QRY24014.1 glycine cleavage system protein GcvH [Halobacterium sp. BOL4-2]